jgi:hypothetical protein
LDKLGCEAPLQTFAAPFAAFVLKNGACALMFFTAKVSMSAQSSQRECSYSEEVQEFGSSFAHLCGSLRGLCVKKWRLGLDVFFTAKVSMSAQSSQRECIYSEGVQEFGSSFAHLCSSLRGLCVKNGGWALMFFYRKGLHVGAKSTKGNIQV